MMMRFYRGFGQRMLLLLMHSRYHGHTSVRQIARDIMDMPVVGSSEEQALIRDIAETVVEGSAEESDIDLMIEEMAERFLKPSQASEGDLIDTLVHILQLPYPRSLFSNKTIMALRKAVLRPDELANLESVRRKELTCVGCQHTFRTGEMVTFYQEGDTGTPLLMCRVCNAPSLGRCNTCTGTARLPKKWYSLLQGRLECGCTAEVPTPVAGPTAGAVAAGGGADNVPFDQAQGPFEQGMALADQVLEQANQAARGMSRVREQAQTGVAPVAGNRILQDRPWREEPDAPEPQVIRHRNMESYAQYQARTRPTPTTGRPQTGTVGQSLRGAAAALWENNDWIGRLYMHDWTPGDVGHPPEVTPGPTAYFAPAPLTLMVDEVANPVPTPYNGLTAHLTNFDDYDENMDEPEEDE